MKYSIYFFYHSFKDVETLGDGSEGIFPKLFNKHEASKDANPDLCLPGWYSSYSASVVTFGLGSALSFTAWTRGFSLGLL